jgi:hypothetical protein
MSHKYQIVPGVIEKLVLGAPFPSDPIFVILSHDDGNFFLSDRADTWTPVTITKAVKKELSSPLENQLYFILIRGYVTSEANEICGNEDPILCLTNIKMIGDCESEETAHTCLSSAASTSASIAFGTSLDFWKTTAPLLSDSELSGYSKFSHHEKAETISKFMRYNALNQVQTSASHSSPMSSNQLYQTTLHDFARSQRDRQLATLAFGRAPTLDAAGAAEFGQLHNLVIDQALGKDLAATLSPEQLCSWHKILYSAYPCAGEICDRRVAGFDRSKIRPSQQIRGDLDRLCIAFVDLEIRLWQNLSPWLAAVTFAAAVLFGINDTDAFAIGSGWLARLAANWALKRAGIPFSVVLFVTEEQRNEYAVAHALTQRNLLVISRGDVSQESLLNVVRDSGCLLPIVNLFVDRIHKAVTVFNRLIEETSLALSEENNACAARLFRERSVAGNCLM